MPARSQRLPAQGIWAALCVAAILAVLAARCASLWAWAPPCPFHALTGFDCPGCGTARGLRALLHGHVLDAIDFNLLLVPALLFTTIGLYDRLSIRGTELWQRINRPRIALWIVVAFWVLRNIPAQPFLWLSAGH